MENSEKIPETCPHCGRDLSPWEQILLSVDRALMCKGCWYRIVLDTFDAPELPRPKKEDDDEII